MANKLNLRIVTPEGNAFEGAVNMVIMRAMDGDIGVMPGHEDLTTVLSYGAMRVFDDSEEPTIYTVMGGFAEISAAGVTILSDAAERDSDIDRDRALAAKERALRILENESNRVEVLKAEQSLRRALVRIEVSSYPIVGQRK